MPLPEGTAQAIIACKEAHMNSRERVLAVFRGQIPDRVPWGEFAVDFDTVERVIGRETFLRAKARSQIALWEGRR
jgi:hypothetical protein